MAHPGNHLPFRTKPFNPLHAIKTYCAADYKVDPEKIDTFIKKFLKFSVALVPWCKPEAKVFRVPSN